MPARSVCLVTLSLSEAGPGRFGRQVSITDIYHTIPGGCGESRKSCALGCGRALLWNALPVARAALGARWKDPTPELVKSFVNFVKVLKKRYFYKSKKAPRNTLFPLI